MCATRAVPFGLLLLAAITADSPAVAQRPDPLNLDFERASIIAPDKPAKWYVGGSGYTIALDTVAPNTGLRSLRVSGGASAAPEAFGVATLRLSPGAIAGKRIRLRGFVRTEAVTHGYAGLWMRIDGPGGKVLAFDNMAARGVTGTTAWTQYEIDLRADSSTIGALFGALHRGDGTAWFDSFSIEIDGQPYTGATADPWQPTSAESSWIRGHAVPLASSNPADALDDLRPIGAMIGDARIVALGEGTHGTSEFFRMKHRLTRYLAQEKGFTVFAIEANMPEARRVNEYVLTGRGDPRAALAGLYFWTWNTQEVLDFIEWMRAYNASGRGRMEFWGFDLQVPTVAMDSVRAFVARADPAFAPILGSAYNQVAAAAQEWQGAGRNAFAIDRWEQEAQRVLSHLRERHSAYIAAGRDTLEVAWAEQNARLVVQGAAAARSTESRDSSMARNVEWIAAHEPPGTKLVLWAHNGHVNRVAGRMGGHLGTRYGDTMRVVGFALGDGSYRAVGPRGLAAYPAAPPTPESIESVLRGTGLPRLALDVRHVATSPGAAWLAAPHAFRSIGAVAMDDGFFPTNVAASFDVLIYFDHTTPSAELPMARAAPR